MVRLLMEKELHVSLRDLVSKAVSELPAKARRDRLVDDVLDFLSDRVAFFLRERGMSYDVVEAVLAADVDDPLDALARAEALGAIRGSEDLERLVIGFKRAANILKGVSGLPSLNAADWTGAHASETALRTATTEAERKLVELRKQKDYAAMLAVLLKLRDPIDRFFDDVLVMSEKKEERERRLALLSTARGLFHHLFDPARIVIEGETAKVK
jgi:glycyl-tRNA synthetase beta chain